MNARKNTEKITVPKQKRSMDTKKTLKSTAKRLFSEKGYHNTSSNEIAKAASVSIGTFYNYYNDKKEVFIELLHDYCNGIISHIKICPIGDADDIISLIGEYIENVMNAHDASKGFHCEMVSLIYTDIQIREIMDGYEKAAMINIEDILRLNESHLKIKDFKVPLLYI